MVYLLESKTVPVKNLAVSRIPISVIGIPQLRDNQKEVKARLYRLIAQGSNRCLLVAPCGAGKTIIAASVVRDAAVIKNKRCLFVVPFTCLISQTLSAFECFGVQAGVIAGEYSEDRSAIVQIATVQTLSMGRDIDWFNWEICFVDEAHITSYSKWHVKTFPLLKDGKQTHSISDIQKELRVILGEAHTFEVDPPPLTYERVKKSYREKSQKAHPDCGGTKEQMQELNKAWEVVRKQKHLFNGTRQQDERILIGLTATPWRLKKGESMGDIFEAQAACNTPSEMIAAGYLVPCVYFGIKGVSLEGVGTVAGDYNLAQLDVRCTEDAAIMSAIDNYLRICPERLFICFACTVNHARLLTEAFKSKGIKAEIITGETKDSARQTAFYRVKTRQSQGIIAVNCISVGFDLPEISCIIHCRPTKSMTLYVQGIGRGMRIALDKENCLVLDQAGNVKRHGFIEDITYPSLRLSRDTEKGAAPVKQCPDCGAYVHISARLCLQCDHEFEIAVKKSRPPGEMKIIVRPEDKANYATHKQLLKRAYQYGMSPFWVVFEMRRVLKDDKFFPPKEWSYQAIFGENPTKQQKLDYLSYLEKVAIKNGWDEWRSQYYYKSQFGAEPDEI